MHSDLNFIKLGYVCFSLGKKNRLSSGSDKGCISTSRARVTSPLVPPSERGHCITPRVVNFSSPRSIPASISGITGKHPAKTSFIYLIGRRKLISCTMANCPGRNPSEVHCSFSVMKSIEEPAAPSSSGDDEINGYYRRWKLQKFWLEEEKQCQI